MNTIDHQKQLILHNPATGQADRALVLASAAAVDQAVEGARKAFDEHWQYTSLDERLHLALALREALARRAEDLAQVICQEVGSPIDFARKQQVATAFNHLDALVDAALGLELDKCVSENLPNHRVRHEPIGVAALVTPWNWPLNQVVLKVGAALLAGCTMVLKPSEYAAGAAYIMAECMDEIGVPPGVFSVLVGDQTAGEALVSNPLIDIVSFTGSTTVGRKIAAQAGANLKPTVMELGGKSANILLADCDLEKAIRQGVAHCFRNTGQSCNAASRMLVAREIYDDAIALALQVATETKVNLPHLPGDHLGPLISQAQFDKVQMHIDVALEEGAKLVFGGPGRPDGFQDGYFVKPTIFADVTPSMAIWGEEVFGPVLAMTPFDSEEEAIHLANDSAFGLSGYIQGRDEKAINGIASRLRVGMVQVNGSSRANGAAFGGIKASGYGREAGLWGIRAFQIVKSVSGICQN